jgi:hypothetical protein
MRQSWPDRENSMANQVNDSLNLGGSKWVDLGMTSAVALSAVRSFRGCYVLGNCQYDLGQVNAK